MSLLPLLQSTELLYYIPVLETHDIVENGVDCGAEVVEETRNVEEILIHPPKGLQKID